MPMIQPTARYRDRRDEILRVAARIFAEKGYHRASMRDIARAAGSSLGGLSYYFPTKEGILYEVSARAFDTVLEGARAAAAIASPEERLRQFVRHHLGYFGTHLTEMKVLSHESDSLTGEHRREIQERKRSYVALATSIAGSLPGAGARRDLRISALALFGMMNWIYTWYRSAGDGDMEVIAATMSDIFLNGFNNGFSRAGETVGAAPAGQKR
jgi:AcrR family transcriptional regulator